MHWGHVPRNLKSFYGSHKLITCLTSPAGPAAARRKAAASRGSVLPCKIVSSFFFSAQYFYFCFNFVFVLCPFQIYFHSLQRRCEIAVSGFVRLLCRVKYRLRMKSLFRKFVPEVAQRFESIRTLKRSMQ